MKKIKQNEAITLIVLIITIIVLLILAGVVLNMVIGEYGILRRTNTASELTNKNQALDELKLKVLEVQTNLKGKAGLKDILDELNNDEQNLYLVSLSPIATIQGIDGEMLPDIGNNPEKIYVKYKNYNFKITQSLKVYFQDEETDSNEENIENSVNKIPIEITPYASEIIETKQELFKSINDTMIQTGETRKINIPQNLIGEELIVQLEIKYGRNENSVAIYFYNDKNEKISNLGTHFEYAGGNTEELTQKYVIPENCQYIEFWGRKWRILPVYEN